MVRALLLAGGVMHASIVAAQAPSTVLAGRVVRAGTLTTIPGAEVRLAPGPQRAVTDAVGHSTLRAGRQSHVGAGDGRERSSADDATCEHGAGRLRRDERRMHNAPREQQCSYHSFFLRSPIPDPRSPIP